MSSHEMSNITQESAVVNDAKDSVADRDNAILARLGKKSVLKREFGFMSMLGFTCTIMITWEGVLVVLPWSFVNGGYAGSVYAYLFVWVGNLAIFTTMAELASMAPTSGGQYHWVAMLSPPSCQKFLSFLTGWIAVIGWQANVASGALFCAQATQGLVKLLHPSYEAHAWQTVLLFYANILMVVFFNTVIIRALPKIESFFLMVHILGLFAILIPLLYMGPHGNASEVFTVFENFGGFQTQGLSLMIGCYYYTWTLLGCDGAIHMSEEIKNAAVIVPRAMIFSLLLNGAMGFAMLISMLFCLGDPKASLTFQPPYMAVFQQAVQDIPGAAAMSGLVVVMIKFATIACLATASRMTWSFARDRGLPGWRYLNRVSERTSTPLISIAATCCISCLLALIILGSQFAFNIVAALTVCCIYTSYLIGNTLLLYRRVTGAIHPYNDHYQGLTNVPDADNLTWGPFRVREPFGTIINFLGVGFTIVILFFSFWPAMRHPKLEYVNFSSVMIVVAVGIACSYYFFWGGKKNYNGPIVEVN